MGNKLFYYSVMNFTLPLISEGEAQNDPAVETFLTAIATTEREGREEFFKVIEPSKKIIKELSEIKSHDLIAVQVFFGKHNIFMSREKISRLETVFFGENIGKNLIAFKLTKKIWLYTEVVWRYPNERNHFRIKNCELI